MEFSVTTRLARFFRLIADVARLPVACLHFDTRQDRADLVDVHRQFTQPHPRYKIFPRKALGVALIDLRCFATRADYLASVEGKGNAAPQSRKARARGYTLRQIDRNAFVGEIHDINVSCEFRQGRPMDPAYREKITHYEDKPYVLYFGIFNKEGRLAAYCNVGLFGNFCGTEQVLGYRNSDGIMYLLLTEIIGFLIDNRRVDYFMYDTMFGASDGLRDFKRRVGFLPYRARYTIACSAGS